MLCGALLTVGRMVKRLPLKLSVFLISSFCGFNPDSPTKADCLHYLIGLSKMVTDFEGPDGGPSSAMWLLDFFLDDCLDLKLMTIQTSFQLFPLWHHMALLVRSDSNGSGVVALLEITRLFSILYSNPNTRERYILFRLTSRGPYNYNGTQKWLRSFDQCMRENVDCVICLNSLGSRENGLWLHVSKPPENVAWEHEQFLKLRVTTTTLSGLSAPPELLESTGVVCQSILHTYDHGLTFSLKGQCIYHGIKEGISRSRCRGLRVDPLRPTLVALVGSTGCLLSENQEMVLGPRRNQIQRRYDH
ncbi:nicalin-1 isoform X2 [Tanacetum coccineum]